MRRSLVEEYRARGHKNQNIWVVYSVKLDRDLLLTSDLQLIHWLAWLECDRYVSTFEIGPVQAIRKDNGAEVLLPVDAAAVKTDRQLEYHLICGGASDPRLAALAELLASCGVQDACPIPISAVQLEQQSKIALRWVKALSFAAPLRGRRVEAARNRVVQYCLQQKRGIAAQLLEAVSPLNASMALGVLVRLSIEGHVGLDLDRKSFGRTTVWCWNGQEPVEQC